MPRFVLLRHECPADFVRPSHWDLMFESGDLLRTWALNVLPGPLDNTVDAEELPDHRMTYLDYEGPISGGRGTVCRSDAGTFELLALSDDCWEIQINGRELNGRLTLRRRADKRWTLAIGAID
jgi:hypothetical protein